MIGRTTGGNRFNIGQFLIGLFIVAPIGLLLACVIPIVGVIIVLCALALIIASFFNKDFFCEDCGQYLGMGLGHPPQMPCDRCGCNIFTDMYEGVGPTYRHQRRRRDRWLD